MKGSNESGTHVFTIKNTFVCRVLPERAKSDQQENKSQIMEMNFRFICMLPRGISPAFRALFLAQHLNPWRAWPPFLQDLQVVLNMNGLATGRQSHAQTQQRQSANRAAEGFYWMQMWTIKSYRPCVKRGSVTFHSLVCNNSTGILVDFQNWHTSPAKCFRCRKTSQQTYSAREFFF